jgi:hypothetical protein
MNWFKRKKQLPEDPEEDYPVIGREDSADNPESSGSGMPIDLIYAYLTDDYERMGYDDALCNPDHSYKDRKITLIRSGLEIKFKQVFLEYNDNLREVNFHIQSFSEAGLIDKVEKLKHKQEILERHIQELKEMEKALQSRELYITGMFISYENGFKKGLAASSLGASKLRKI